MSRVHHIISGSIAAYKGLEVLRLLKEAGVDVHVILTKGGAEFVTPLSCAALSGNPVRQNLFSLTEEAEMGHIRLARDGDLILIAPATADLLAKMAQGIADDLATTLLLASSTPIVIAPAMNAHMWHHPQTQGNVEILKARGVIFVGPDEGDLACGEVGFGKMSAPDVVASEVLTHLGHTPSLKGKKAIVTAGPTREPIDPVRYISNHSSGKQGYAIARALQKRGAEVHLISGPTPLDPPAGVIFHGVQTADEMREVAEAHLPADIAIFTAAVVDWKIPFSPQKTKKTGQPPTWTLEENPDILKIIAHHALRPTLVVGFAAETENLEVNAREKFLRKGCDMLLANDVSKGVFGSDENEVLYLDQNQSIRWPSLSKDQVAEELTHIIEKVFHER